MAAMAGRIARVRGELQAALEKRCPDRDFSYITAQIGMFSYTGMTPQQVSYIERLCTMRLILRALQVLNYRHKACSL